MNTEHSMPFITRIAYPRAVTLNADCYAAKYVAPGYRTPTREEIETRAFEDDIFDSQLQEAEADLLDDWAKISKQQKDSGATLRYQQYDDGTGPYLLRYPLDPDLERIESKAAQFKTHRSLRDVEPACNLRLIELNGNAIDPEEDLE